MYCRLPRSFLGTRLLRFGNQVLQSTPTHSWKVCVGRGGRLRTSSICRGGDDDDELLPLAEAGTSVSIVLSRSLSRSELERQAKR